MNYKSYQQVLDLTGSKKRSPKARPVQSGDSIVPKRRTKSGCLTCRRRKKKCDEETEGGKCQACIRNFLDCCWAGETHSHKQESSPVTMASETDADIKCSSKPEYAPSTAPRNGASAYPSPISSPKVKPLEETKNIQTFTLPPSKTKVMKPQRKRAISKSKSEFIVTSFDSRKALCQIK